MPTTFIVTAVVLAVIGTVFFYFLAEYRMRNTQNTSDSNMKPTTQPRQNNDIVEGYDSMPETSKKEDSSAVQQREDVNCAICQDTGPLSFIAPCKHEFHPQCIGKWQNALRTSTYPCPICRENIISSYPTNDFK